MARRAHGVADQCKRWSCAMLAVLALALTRSTMNHNVRVVARQHPVLAKLRPSILCRGIQGGEAARVDVQALPVSH